MLRNWKWTHFTLITLASLFLLRALAVEAAESDNDNDDADVEEVFANEMSGKKENWKSPHEAQESGRVDIHISRPHEALSRIEKDTTDFVPGAEHLLLSEDNLAVPGRSGRQIAALPGQSSLTSNPVQSDMGRSPAQNTVTPEISRVLHTTPNPSLKTDASQNPLTAHPIEPKLLGQDTQEVSLIVHDAGYFPKKVFATQNVPVKIYFSTSSKSTLCFMLDTWGLKKGVAPGKVETLEFTPDRAGEFKFYCPVRGIEGTLVVREPAMSLPATYSAVDDSAVRTPAAEPARSASANEPKNAPQLRALIE